MLNKSTEKVRGIVREENLIFTNLEQSNVTHRYRDNIILQRTRPRTKLYCSDEINNTRDRQYTQAQYFSNSSPVYYCISYCSLCPYLLK